MLLASFILFLSCAVAFPLNLQHSVLNGTLIDQRSENYFKSLKKYKFPSAVYEQLYWFANITAVSYCALPITNVALKEGPTLDCRTQFCHDHENEYSVEEIFKPVKVEFDLHLNFSSLLNIDLSGNFMTRIEREFLTKSQITGVVLTNHNEKEIILAFRGTQTIMDAFTDTKIIQEDYKPMSSRVQSWECPGCQVHKGFYDVIKDTFNKFDPEIQKLTQKYPDYKLVITGHSLGGAVAQLAGLEYKLLGYENMVVVGLAGPKVGNKKFCDYTDKVFNSKDLHEKMIKGNITKLDSGFWRVAIVTDMVPMLPPGPNYYHAGLEFAVQGTDPLPQPQSRVSYIGLYKYKDFFAGMPWKGTKVPDFLHIYQHLHYFNSQTEGLESVIKSALGLLHIGQ